MAQGQYVLAARMEDLGERGHRTVRVGSQNVLLLRSGDRIHAVDWRCPHMGFPLSKGTVQDGILTCHWHHARFDLASGGTFDPFADDVRVFPLRIEQDEIWVDPSPQRDEIEYQLGRLLDGLERNLSLVIAKAVLSLLDQQVDPAEILQRAGRFGAIQRAAGWRDGLTIMTAMGNLLEDLAPEDHPLALYHGLLHVANNVRGQPPHYPLDPLDAVEPDRGTLRGWLRRFAGVRDRDGVERVLLTAINTGLAPGGVAEMLLAAATDHYYLDGGHTIDFVNKAFELLDLVGWESAGVILPSIVPGITGAQRMEETSAWRTPVDLTAILDPIFDDLLAGRLRAEAAGGETLAPPAFDTLVDTLLGDDPQESATALATALRDGISLEALALAVTHAAAVRVALFHTSNEFGDWISVLHSLTSANAARRLLQRAPSLDGARALWHSAMHLYLNRFLNLPLVRPPTPERLAALPADPPALLDHLSALTERQQQVEEAAAIVWRYRGLEGDDRALIQTLARTLLREDGEFHSYQMLEAGTALFHDLAAWHPQAATWALVAVARYLAGHAPTARATTQTYRIAERLHAGEALAAE